MFISSINYNKVEELDLEMIKFSRLDQNEDEIQWPVD
jgi:hypothetical protein